jgi:Staphylococcal nuclease homologue
MFRETFREFPLAVRAQTGNPHVQRARKRWREGGDEDLRLDQVLISGPDRDGEGLGRLPVPVRAAQERPGFDGDHDGVACESLPCPCSKAKGGSGGGHHGAAVPRASRLKARVIEAVDGDTLKVRLRRNHSVIDVRLIGIDTPETRRPGTPIECGGPQASASMHRLADRRRVTLVTDPSQDRFDRYGRLLAYAIRRSGLDLNLASCAAAGPRSMSTGETRSGGSLPTAVPSTRPGQPGAASGAAAAATSTPRPAAERIPQRPIRISYVGRRTLRISAITARRWPAVHNRSVTSEKLWL